MLFSAAFFPVFKMKRVQKEKRTEKKKAKKNTKNVKMDGIKIQA